MGTKVYVQTQGCQMNEYDSAKMFDVLAASEGAERVEDPAAADLLLDVECNRVSGDTHVVLRSSVTQLPSGGSRSVLTGPTELPELFPEPRERCVARRHRRRLTGNTVPCGFGESHVFNYPSFPHNRCVRTGHTRHRFSGIERRLWTNVSPSREIPDK